VAQARIIDGRAHADELRRRVAEFAVLSRAEIGGPPGLATVLVGDHPASQTYVGAKARACGNAGIAAFDIRLGGGISETELLAEIEKLNSDERVDGVLVQLPLPPQIDPHRIMAAIDPVKDVDGFHPVNIGKLWSGLPGLVPCTPQGCLRLLRGVHQDLTGAAAVVLGRSNIVGKPVAALLLAADCTVTVVHSKTRNISEICRRADILVAAVGRPLMVKGEWVKPGATVIDVGVNAITRAEGPTRIVGDVDFAEVQAVAGAITPVPGGVGPMTIACLLLNTLSAACHRRGLPEPLL
jgi:methylenetetrahydrofolate dehydrogenase (NADP+) / methenyltetrahydrofolate cyclohydrolase